MRSTPPPTVSRSRPNLSTNSKGGDMTPAVEARYTVWKDQCEWVTTTVLVQYHCYLLVTSWYGLIKMEWFWAEMDLYCFKNWRWLLLMMEVLSLMKIHQDRNFHFQHNTLCCTIWIWFWQNCFLATIHFDLSTILAKHQTLHRLKTKAMQGSIWIWYDHVNISKNI